MGTIFTPLNQIKLTNVSIVRLKKGGKRFEVAAYKNKVMDWRNGLETDLDNVVQTHQVFSNVSKGQLASNEDLNKAFKTTDSAKILLEILSKGELQINERERTQTLTQLFSSIATVVASLCVDPSTNVPYTPSIIEKAMQEVHFSVNPNKSAKQQALEVIRVLKEKGVLRIERAQMRVRVVVAGKDGKRVREEGKELFVTVEGEEWGDDYEVVALIDPGKFRVLTEFVQNETKGKGTVEVLSVKETVEGDEVLA
ncbi:hypothetical protein HK098_005391 [Nowakowskiella sp. JEL0407]|nr:hypothetical protein HK098_005391 [Nowakowskiella sp. JEL0407]